MMARKAKTVLIPSSAGKRAVERKAGEYMLSGFVVSIVRTSFAEDREYGSEDVGGLGKG